MFTVAYAYVCIQGDHHEHHGLPQLSGGCRVRETLNVTMISFKFQNLTTSS